MAHNVVFSRVQDIPWTKLENPQFAVYNSPKEYPGKAVAKVMDDRKNTNMVIVKENLGELCKEIRNNISLVWFWRGKDDDPDLLGVFL